MEHESDSLTWTEDAMSRSRFLEYVKNHLLTCHIVGPRPPVLGFPVVPPAHHEHRYFCRCLGFIHAPDVLAMCCARIWGQACRGRQNDRTTAPKPSSQSNQVGIQPLGYPTTQKSSDLPTGDPAARARGWRSSDHILGQNQHGKNHRRQILFYERLALELLRS